MRRDGFRVAMGVAHAVPAAAVVTAWATLERLCREGVLAHGPGRQPTDVASPGRSLVGCGPPTGSADVPTRLRGLRDCAQYLSHGVTPAPHATSSAAASPSPARSTHCAEGDRTGRCSPLRPGPPPRCPTFRVPWKHANGSSSAATEAAAAVRPTGAEAELGARTRKRPRRGLSTGGSGRRSGATPAARPRRPRRTGPGRGPPFADRRAGSRVRRAPPEPPPPRRARVPPRGPPGHPFHPGPVKTARTHPSVFSLNMS